MALNVPSSRRNAKVRRLIAEERRLIQEKAALEVMLKNVRDLRTKLKVEQIQLCSHIQSEIGEDVLEIPTKTPRSPDPLQFEDEENNVVLNRPTLHLEVNSLQNTFFGKDAENEEEEEEEEDDLEEIGCAKEVLGNLEENDIDFENF